MKLTRQLNRRLVCKNGVSFSVQANSFVYSEPREDCSQAYSECEVGFIQGGDAPPYFEEYGESNGGIYAYVPVHKVEQFIAENGGIDLGVLLGDGGFPHA